MSYMGYLLKEHFGIDEVAPIVPVAAAGLGATTLILSGMACAKYPKCSDAVKKIPDHFKLHNPNRIKNRRSFDDTRKGSDAPYYTYNSDSNQE